MVDRLIGVKMTIDAMLSAIVIFLFGAFIVQACDRDPPMQEMTPPTVLTPVVKPGGELDVSMNNYRARVCAITVKWLIFDGIGRVTQYALPQIEAFGEIGPDPMVRPFTIPRDAAPGSARLRLTAEWVCPGNYVQEFKPITKVYPDFHFKIAAP